VRTVYIILNGQSHGLHSAAEMVMFSSLRARAGAARG
jgi:hypothetical protein